MNFESDPISSIYDQVEKAIDRFYEGNISKEQRMQMIKSISNIIRQQLNKIIDFYLNKSTSQTQNSNFNPNFCQCQDNYSANGLPTIIGYSQPYSNSAMNEIYIQMIQQQQRQIFRQIQKQQLLLENKRSFQDQFNRRHDKSSKRKKKQSKVSSEKANKIKVNDLQTKSSPQLISQETNNRNQFLPNNNIKQSNISEANKMFTNWGNYDNRNKSFSWNSNNESSGIYSNLKRQVDLYNFLS